MYMSMYLADKVSQNAKHKIQAILELLLLLSWTEIPHFESLQCSARAPNVVAGAGERHLRLRDSLHGVKNKPACHH